MSEIPLLVEVQILLQQPYPNNGASGEKAPGSRGGRNILNKKVDTTKLPERTSGYAEDPSSSANSLTHLSTFLGYVAKTGYPRTYIHSFIQFPHFLFHSFIHSVHSFSSNCRGKGGSCTKSSLSNEPTTRNRRARYSQN